MVVLMWVCMDGCGNSRQGNRREKSVFADWNFRWYIFFFFSSTFPPSDSERGKKSRGCLSRTHTFHPGADDADGGSLRRGKKFVGVGWVGPITQHENRAHCVVAVN
jgi:hypothetical protein